MSGAVDDLAFTLKETLSRVEGKVDGLATAVSTLQITAAADRASLVARIENLERASDRRWQLLPTWIASVLALFLAALPYLHLH